MKRSKLLLAAWIISVLYLIYVVVVCVGFFDEAESIYTQIGGAIASALIAPHLIFVAVAAIFNGIGWGINRRWGALTAGILYAVSILLMPIFILNVLLQTIFCFVSYACMPTNQEISRVQAAKRRELKRQEELSEDEFEVVPAPLPKAKKPLNLTSSDLIRADAMMEYCKYFDFLVSVSEQTCMPLFSLAEDALAPDQEAVMSFICLKDYNGIMDNSGSCACVVGASKIVLASESGAEYLPILDIGDPVMRKDGMVAVIDLPVGDQTVKIAVEASISSYLFDCFKRSIVVCREEAKAAKQELEDEIAALPEPESAGV